METLRIDGYIGADDGMSMLFGGSPNFSLKSLNNYLDNLPTGVTELNVEINSGGGSVTEGFAIHDKLASSGLTIHTEVLGLCGSIATIIALSAKSENRSMHENSEYFIHNPFWQPMSPTAMEADDLERLADELRSSEEKILDFYSEKTGQKRNAIKDYMQRSKSFSAKEAKQMGFVSSIISQAVSSQKYLIAAYVDPTKLKTKPTDMEFTASQKSYFETKFNELLGKVNKIFTPVFKAQKLELENGSQIFIDAETDEITGKGAFADEQKGVLTDGEYVAKDGRTIKVSAGLVAEVVAKKVDNGEIDLLKTQITDLTEKLTAAEQKAQTAETAKTELETNVVALKKEVTEFKNMVLSGDMKGAEQNFKGQSAVKQSENEAWLAYKRKKADAAKN